MQDYAVRPTLLAVVEKSSVRYVYAKTLVALAAIFLTAIVQHALHHDASMQHIQIHELS